MKWLYGYDAHLPHRGADAEQVLNTIAAVARAGAELTLAVPRRRGGGPTQAELAEYYGVEGPFRVETLSSVPVGGRVPVKLRHAAAVARLAQRHDPDIVHTRHLPVAFACLAAGRRVLYETYRPWPSQYPAARRALGAAMRHENMVGMVFHSQLAADSFLELGVAPARVLVAHNGYEPRRLEPRLSKADARRVIGEDPHRPVVTYTGRVDPEKGVGLILDMAQACPEATFLVVGSRGEGPLERRAASLANVRMVPWKSYTEVVPYLYAADALVIPPTLAPLTRVGNTVLPMKAFMYLAAGRVIVAPRAPDTADLLYHERNALLVTPGDLSDAVATLRRVFSDAALARRVADGALSTASGLTWTARGARLLDFVQARLRAGHHLHLG